MREGEEGRCTVGPSLKEGLLKKDLGAYQVAKA